MRMCPQALPKSVIKNGSVIEIRSGVAAMLHGAAPEDRPDIVVVPTPGAAACVLSLDCSVFQ